MIRIEDIAHVRFTAPDLERMAGFLETFGLVPAVLEPDRIFFRGAGSAPFVHVTERGEPGFKALGLRAESVADLEILARETGATVEPFDAPGGGQVVRQTDPDGNLVEVVAGQTPVEALPLAPATLWNSAQSRPRQRQVKRTGAGPAQVLRIGHAVLDVTDFRASERWYKERFGFLTSDEIQLGPEFALGAFLRCDRGATLTDHHTLFLLQHPNGKGFNHAAFEVRDLDDLMRGHEHLKTSGAKPQWGVGRHILGSQVFDYWFDPWGHPLEHWTDGDLFTAEDPPGVAGPQELLGVQWGQAFPPPTA